MKGLPKFLETKFLERVEEEGIVPRDERRKLRKSPEMKEGNGKSFLLLVPLIRLRSFLHQFLFQFLFSVPLPVSSSSSVPLRFFRSSSSSFLFVPVPLLFRDSFLSFLSSFRSSSFRSFVPLSFLSRSSSSFLFSFERFDFWVDFWVDFGSFSGRFFFTM